MTPALLVAVVLGQTALSDFKAAFPAATLVEAPGGGRLVSAVGFEAPGLGTSPEKAARAFLRSHGAAFGVTARQKLVALRASAAGQPGSIRFERRIDGLRIFDGDVVVGVNAAGAVFLVNASNVPAAVQGRFAVQRQAAVRAARRSFSGGVEAAAAAKAERGWRAVGEVVRPAWRVELSASEPAGLWAVFVDGESAAILDRVDLRVDTASSGGVAPPKAGFPPAGR